MAKKRISRWAKAQPHDAKSGRITTKRYAEKHPEKVEWISNKNKKK